LTAGGDGEANVEKDLGELALALSSMRLKEETSR